MDNIGKIPMSTPRETEKDIFLPGGEKMMLYPDVPLFQFRRFKIAETLLRRCGLNEGSRVLEVGHGSGFVACRLAEERGSCISVVYPSPSTVEFARRRAKRRKVDDRVTVELSGSEGLPFENDTFDLVFTQFVTTFLDKGKALKEYFRVAKPGGYLGIVGFFRIEKMPESSLIEIAKAEELISRASGLDFHLPTLSEWKGWFENAGIFKVRTATFQKITVGEALKCVRLTGLAPFLNVFLRVLSQLAFFRNRENNAAIDRAKKILFRKRRTSRYVETGICIGKKPPKNFLVVSPGRFINL